MRRCIFWISAIFTITASPSAMAESWLCTGDSATGFSYKSYLKRWTETKFKTDDSRYVIRPAEGRTGLEVRMVGETNKFISSWCKEGVNESGFVFCDGLLGSFRFNVKNLRYVKTSTFGYFNVVPEMNKITDESSDTIDIEIGRCAAL